MNLTRRRILHLAAGAPALPFVSGFARAQSYPMRPVRIIVGFPPGVTPELLDGLQSSGVVRSWSVPHEGARRWHG